MTDLPCSAPSCSLPAVSFSQRTSEFHCIMHCLCPPQHFTPEDQSLLSERNKQADAVRAAVGTLRARAALELNSEMDALKTTESRFVALLGRCFQAEKRRHEQLYQQTVSELVQVERELDRYRTDKQWTLSKTAALLANAGAVPSVLKLRVRENDEALARLVSDTCARRKSSLSELLATVSSLDTSLSKAHAALQSYDLSSARKAYSRLQSYDSSEALESLRIHIDICEVKQDTAVDGLLASDCEAVAAELSQWQSTEECSLGAFPFLPSVSKAAASASITLGDVIMRQPCFAVAKQLYTQAQHTLATFFSDSSLSQEVAVKLGAVIEAEERAAAIQTRLQAAQHLSAGKTAMRSKQYAEAEAALKTVLDLCGETDYALMTEAKACLGKVCIDSQRIPSAESYLLVAAETASKLDRQQSATVMASIGCWLRDVGRTDLAKQMLRVAAEGMSQGDPAQGLTLSILGAVLAAKGRVQKAIAAYESGLASIGEQVSEAVAHVHRNLALCYSEMNNLPAALKHFKCCLAILVAVDPTSLFTALVQLQVGDWCLSHHMPGDCEDCYQATWAASASFSYSELSVLSMKLAVLYSSAERFAEADNYVVTALQYMRAADPDSPEVASMVLSHAIVREHLLDFAQAQSYYEECLCLLPTDHPSLFSVYAGLARVAECSGQLSAAVSHWTSATHFLVHRSSDPDLLIETFAALGKAYEALAQWEQAEKAYRTALEHQLIVGGKEEMAGVLYRAVGVLCVQMKKHEMAEITLLRATAILKEQSGCTQALADVYRHLAALYIDWSKFEKAEKALEEGCAVDRAFLKLPGVASSIDALISQFAAEKKEKWEQVKKSLS